MPSEGSKVVRLKVADLLTTRDGSAPNKDARLTNCFIEDVQGQPQVLKRSGYSGTATSGSGQGHGATVFTNSTTGAEKVYCVTGSSAYVSMSGTGTSQIINGTFAVATNEMVDWLQYFNGTGVVLKCSTEAYTINVATDAVTKITSSYPSSTARGMLYLDSRFYVIDKNGTIWNSEVDDPTTWNGGLNQISAAIEPDGGVALAKSGQYIVAFGQYTTEFFYDSGASPGSPLAPVQNGTLLKGCAHANSLAYGDSSFYILAQAKAQGQATGFGFEVGKVTDTRYEKVSNDSIERILNADGVAVCFGNVISILAHSFYTIALPASGLTLALDMETKLWYVFTTSTAAAPVTLTTLTSATNVDGTTVTATATKAGHGFSDGDVVTMAGADQVAYNIQTNVTVVSSSVYTYQIPSIPATPATGTITATSSTSSYYPLTYAAGYGTGQIAQRVTDGVIVSMSDTVYTDAAIYIDLHMRTARIDNEKNQPKFLAWMDVITDRASMNALVRFTDDDFRTYSKYRKTSLSGKRSRLNRQGSFLRRSFELRVTDSGAFRFQGLDLGLEEGME